MDRTALPGEVDPFGALAARLGPVEADVAAFALLEAVPGLVTLVEPDGTVRWISGIVEELTGYRPDELVGTNIFDHLDVTWNPRTIESIGYAIDNPGRRLPTMLRFHKKDGSPIVLEATANNQYDTPGIHALVAYLRDCDEQQLLEEILEALAAGREFGTIVDLLHTVAASDTLRSDSALVLLSPGLVPDGPVLTWSDEVAGLVAHDEDEAPWRTALRTGKPVVVGAAEALPPVLGVAASAAGYAACWAFPVSLQGHEHPSAVLVFWRTEAGDPEPNAWMIAERLVRLTALMIERFAHLQELEHAANHDGLTGLVNRRHFFDQVEARLDVDGVSTGSDGLGVLYLDLDRFKPINDRLGHAAGDQVLVAVATRLLAAAEPGDVVARLGGDEFAICCRAASTDDLRRRAAVLAAAIARPVEVDGIVLTVGASIGVARATGREAGGDVLVNAADAALLDAKASRRAAP